jgi:hypothetical protein
VTQAQKEAEPLQYGQSTAKDFISGAEVLKEVPADEEEKEQNGESSLRSIRTGSMLDQYSKVARRTTIRNSVIYHVHQVTVDFTRVSTPPMCALVLGPFH